MFICEYYVIIYINDSSIDSGFGEWVLFGLGSERGVF